MIENVIEAVRVIAPEDLNIGDYVITHAVVEAFHCVQCEPGTVLTTRFERTPSWEVKPLRVRAVCLPYVFCVTASRGHEMVDVRRERLAVVPEAFARAVWSRVRLERERKERSEKDGS